MERKYTILAALLIILAFGLVILPKKKDLSETDPRVLLSSIAEQSRFLSVDQVTQRIIESDPTLLLIDLRSPEEYKTFALPGAVNIHPDSLLSASNAALLNQPGKDKVLYGNADLEAEKIWVLSTRYSIDRMYIMKGGLNEWYQTIIQPKEISMTASTAEINLNSFRVAARQYFTGAGEMANANEVKKAPAKINMIRKAPERSSGGGC